MDSVTDVFLVSDVVISNTVFVGLFPLWLLNQSVLLSASVVIDVTWYNGQP